LTHFVVFDLWSFIFPPFTSRFSSHYTTILNYCQQISILFVCPSPQLLARQRVTSLGICSRFAPASVDGGHVKIAQVQAGKGVEDFLTTRRLEFNKTGVMEKRLPQFPDMRSPGTGQMSRAPKGRQFAQRRAQPWWHGRIKTVFRANGPTIFRCGGNGWPVGPKKTTPRATPYPGLRPSLD
jgi:hypothetical protein